jgi:hypothetical protein
MSADGAINVTKDIVFIINFNLNLVVVVTGSTSQNLVHMTYPDNSNPEHSFTISFNGNASGQKVEIFQDFVSIPQSGSNYLSTQAVKFHTALGNNGTKYYTNPSVLTIVEQMLYTSYANSDTLKVVYEFNEFDIGNQVAGIYSSTITFKVKWGGNVYLFDVQFEVEILPFFELQVVGDLPDTPQTPDGAFSFGDELTPLSGPKTIPLKVSVNTNSATPYKVMHNLLTPLTNVANNSTIPNNLLNYRVELVGISQGTVAPASYTAVPVGSNVPIFTSLSTGKAAQVRLTYRLGLSTNLNQTISGIKGGDYRAPFVLTLVPN